MVQYFTFITTLYHVDPHHVPLGCPWSKSKLTITLIQILPSSSIWWWPRGARARPRRWGKGCRRCSRCRGSTRRRWCTTISRAKKKWSNWLHYFFYNFASTVKPINVINLVQNQSDNINRMKTITGDFYLEIISKWDLWNMVP